MNGMTGMNPLLASVWVGVGGAAGALVRYGASEATAWLAGRAFVPWATLLVNVIGCGVIGFIAARAGRDDVGWLVQNRPLVAVGFCGALTTFSTFGLESITLLSRRPGLGIAVIVAHVTLGLGAVVLGGRLAA